MQKVVMSVYIARRTFLVLCAVRRRCLRCPAYHIRQYPLLGVWFLSADICLLFFKHLSETSGVSGYRNIFKFIFRHYFSRPFFLSFISKLFFLRCLFVSFLCFFLPYSLIIFLSFYLCCSFFSVSFCHSFHFSRVLTPHDAVNLLCSGSCDRASLT